MKRQEIPTQVEGFLGMVDSTKVILDCKKCGYHTEYIVINTEYPEKQQDQNHYSN
jgi:hypothetical protein